MRVQNPATRNALRRTQGLNPPTKGPTVVGVSNGCVSFVGDVVAEAHTYETVAISGWTFFVRFPVFFCPPFPFIFLGGGCGGENGTNSIRPFASPFLNNFRQIRITFCFPFLY